MIAFMREIMILKVRGRTPPTEQHHVKLNFKMETGQKDTTITLQSEVIKGVVHTYWDKWSVFDRNSCTIGVSVVSFETGVFTSNTV